MVEEIISQMGDGGHFGFGALTELAHTFGRGMGAKFFYLAFIEDKSSEKQSLSLNGHGSAVNDPTIS